MNVHAFQFFKFNVSLITNEFSHLISTDSLSPPPSSSSSYGGLKWVVDAHGAYVVLLGSEAKPSSSRSNPSDKSSGMKKEKKNIISTYRPSEIKLNLVGAEKVKTKHHSCEEEAL